MGRAVAEYSFLGFLIVLITNASDGDNLRYDAVVSNAKDGFAALLASFLVYISHRLHFRPFYMVLLTHTALLGGILILCFAPSSWAVVFYLALVLLSSAESGGKFMDEFLADPNTVSDLVPFFMDLFTNHPKHIDFWWLIVRIIGVVIAAFGISSMEFKTSLAISAAAIIFGFLFFLIFTRLLAIPGGPSEGGSDQDQQVDCRHELWPLRKLIPLWTPFVFYYVVEAAGSTFFIEQRKIFHFSEQVLYMIQKFSGLMFSCLINYIIAKIWSRQHSNHPESNARLTKIISGMTIGCGCCLLAWHVERKRLSLINRDDIPDAFLTFKFVLQFILLGTMKALVRGSMEDLFKDHVPQDKPLHHLEFVFNSFVEGIGMLSGIIWILIFRDWIQDTVDGSRLDKYYGALGVINLCALLGFICLSLSPYYRNIRKQDQSIVRPRPTSATDESEVHIHGINGGNHVEIEITEHVEIEITEQVSTGESILPIASSETDANIIIPLSNESPVNIHGSNVEIEVIDEASTGYSSVPELSPQPSAYYSAVEDELEDATLLPNPETTASKWSIVRQQYSLGDMRRRNLSQRFKQ